MNTPRLFKIKERAKLIEDLKRNIKRYKNYMLLTDKDGNYELIKQTGTKEYQHSMMNAFTRFNLGFIAQQVELCKSLLGSVTDENIEYMITNELDGIERRQNEPKR